MVLIRKLTKKELVVMKKQALGDMVSFFSYLNTMGRITFINLQTAMLLADRMCWALYKRSISGLKYIKGDYELVMKEYSNTILSCMMYMGSKDLNTETKQWMLLNKDFYSTEIDSDMKDFLPVEKNIMNKAYYIVMSQDYARKRTHFSDIVSPYKSCIKYDIEESEKELTDAEERILQEAMETDDYSKLEELVSTWINKNERIVEGIEKYDRILSELTLCTEEAEVDALFEKEEIKNYKERSFILNRCMGGLKQWGIEEEEEEEYELERYVFVEGKWRLRN